MRRVWIGAAAGLAALAMGAAALAQGTLGRAPDWATRLAASDIVTSNGGRPTLAAEGVQFSVRVTIAPHQGGVARVIRVDARADDTTLFLRRFTGHPTTGWWMWGPDTPHPMDLTAAQRSEVERLARSVLSVGTGGVDAPSSCPNGERAFIEIAVGTRATSIGRDCIGNDPASQLATALSTLAGSRDEQELYEAAIAELMAVDRAFNAMVQEDGAAEAFAHFAGDGALQFANGQEPAAGREAIAAYWARASQGAEIAWEPEAAQVSARGDMGWTWGRGTATVNGATTTTRYVTVWRRDYEGRWRFVADIANRGPAPSRPSN